jgi:hypothetical protein
VNAITEETSLPDGFNDGCWGVYKRLSTEKFAISAPREMRRPRVSPRLTISGHLDATYVFLQGTEQATPYRQKRVADTSSIWNARANLVVKEVPWGPTSPKADIRIWFGAIPQVDILGWSVIANQSISVIRENVAPTKLEDQKSEEKLL